MKGYPASPKSIGAAIRKRRLDLDLRQIDVAEIISSNELPVVIWEKGQRMPRVNQITRIVRFLGYNPLSTGSTIGERLSLMEIAGTYRSNSPANS